MSNLLVQNIKHTNGTTAQTIDSSGRITTSTSRPHFFCLGFSTTSDNASSGTTINGLTLDSTWRLIRNFEQVIENYGNHYDNSTGIFTVPISGIYMLSLGVGYTEATSDYIGLGIITGDSEDSNTGLRTNWDYTDYNDTPMHMGFCKYLIAGKSVAACMREEASNVTSPNDGHQKYFHWNVTFLG
jgi:hypothetical protein